KFFYTLGLNMVKKGFKSFDDASIHTYLMDNEVLKEGFNRRGGFESVNEMKAILNVENVEGYYDELIKNNAILQLHDEGYDVIKYFKNFEKMTYEQLEDFMEYKLNNIFLKSTSSGISTADLTSNYDSWIDLWNSGIGVGYKVGFPMINYHLAGIHKKNLILHLGGIGQGKTTSSMLFYVLPILESGDKICIIANEQDEEQFRQMIIATVLFNRINYRKMNRQKLLFGNFTEDDKSHLRQASKWLEQYKNQLYYVHLTDYGTSNVKRIIKKYSKLGVGCFLFDTLKPTDESSDKAWAEFSETAKMLFMLAQKEDIAII
ncbi:DNA helicase, partial [Butyricicoccus sp. 1XD8-22]